MAAGCAGDVSEVQVELDGLQFSSQVRSDGDPGLGLHADAVLGRIREGSAVRKAVRVKTTEIGIKPPVRTGMYTGIPQTNTAEGPETSLHLGLKLFDLIELAPA